MQRTPPHRAHRQASMKKGFHSIMSAQFCSSLADNALLVAAYEMLKRDNAPSWQLAALVPMFALFYVVLAPFVGAFADRLPKGRVMFIANGIKLAGCLLMLGGLHPLLAYAVVGLGAATYSPAKYGILTEMLPPSLLVKANGWIEGLTIGSIIMGVLLGGQLISPRVSDVLLRFDFPLFDTPVETAPQAAIASLMALYLVAAGFNLRIPKTGVEMQPMPASMTAMAADFWSCNVRLWKDKLGQISLAATTLFWGVSGSMRVLVLAWAAMALGFNTTQASGLQGVVAVGTAAGAIVASMYLRLDHAVKMIPMGIGMGLMLLFLLMVNTLWVAIPFLILLGALGGFLVVPMNALLQHRGHELMGAGRSIAVQNFNEQACILLLGLFYSVMMGSGRASDQNEATQHVVVVFGLMVAGVMCLIGLWHLWNRRRHGALIEQLMARARCETH